MQLLFERSDELEPTLGLGLIAGEVTRLQRRRAAGPAHRLERGALRAALAADRPGCPRRARLLPRALPRRAADAITTRGRHHRVRRAVRDDRRARIVFGVQFHPEKSSPHGLTLLDELRRVCARRRPAGAARMILLPGDRHPRRQGRAAGPRRVRSAARVRRRPARRGPALGRGRRARAARRRSRRRAQRRAGERRARPADRRRGRRAGAGRWRAALDRGGPGGGRRRGRAGGARDRRASATSSSSTTRSPSYGDRVIVSVDARGGQLAAAGWTEQTEIPVEA